jgi:hypothetical protein
MEVLDKIPLCRRHNFHDHQLPAAVIWAMYLAVAEARRGLEEDFGDFTERHPEGIHRAKGVHLSARAVDAAGD